MDDNPITDRESAFEELGPTRALTSYDKQMRTSQPSAEVRRIIGEIGLRYRPAAQADLEAHAARIALLALDVADIPPHILRRAGQDWIRRSEFMPKASDLISLAQSYVNMERGGSGIDRDSRENAERLAAKYNARLLGEGKRHIHWIVDEQNGLKMEPA